VETVKHVVEVLCIKGVGGKFENDCLVASNVGFDGTRNDKHQIDVKRSAFHLKNFGYRVKCGFRSRIDAVPGCRSERCVRLEMIHHLQEPYISPTMDPILMMSPLLRFAMDGTTAFAMRRAANVFVSNVCFT